MIEVFTMPILSKAVDILEQYIADHWDEIQQAGHDGVSYLFDQVRKFLGLPVAVRGEVSEPIRAMADDLNSKLLSMYESEKPVDNVGMYLTQVIIGGHKLEQLSDADLKLLIDHAQFVRQQRD